MMAVVILLDCHSCLQASLGGTTWGIYYKRRPTSVTATIITFSLSCNAVADSSSGGVAVERRRRKRSNACCGSHWKKKLSGR